MRTDMLLRTARHQAGLTQRELARRTGIPQSTIARVERGQDDPRTTTLDALLLGCGQLLTTAPGVSDLAALDLSERASQYLPEIVRRLANQFRPSRIILFGSQATGRATPSSDVDLLVIVPQVGDKRALRVAIRQALADLPIDKDILVLSEQGATTAPVGSIAASALHEGMIIHAS